jgi:hypothetical protein
MELPIYFYVIIISAIAGITIFFQRPKPLYLRLFPFFLVITIVVELVANWMYRRYGSTIALINFYLVLNFCFFLFVLREIISDRIFKRVALIANISYGVLVLFNLFYYQKLNTWNSMSFSLGCLLIVAFCIYYFLELFRNPKSTRLTKEPAFWIVSGLLFFYCCSFPFLGLNNLLDNAPEVLKRNLNNILTVLNILMYSLFTIAFLCRLHFRKPTI